MSLFRKRVVEARKHFLQHSETRSAKRTKSLTNLETITEKAARHKEGGAQDIRGENRKIKEKISNAKTYLIRCDVDAAPREVEKFVKPRSER